MQVGPDAASGISPDPDSLVTQEVCRASGILRYLQGQGPRCLDPQLPDGF